MRYKYKVIPAPERGEKVKGVRDAEGRFAAAIERIMNDMAQRGWEYHRCETLPSDEGSVLTQHTTVWRNLLVFRRPELEEVSSVPPRMLAPPTVVGQPEAARGTENVARKANAQARIRPIEPVPESPAPATPAASALGAEAQDAAEAAPGDAGPDTPAPKTPTRNRRKPSLPSVLTARAMRLKASEN